MANAPRRLFRVVDRRPSDSHLVDNVGLGHPAGSVAGRIRCRKGKYEARYPTRGRTVSIPRNRHREPYVLSILWVARLPAERRVLMRPKFSRISTHSKPGSSTSIGLCTPRPGHVGPPLQGLSPATRTLTEPWVAGLASPALRAAPPPAPPARWRHPTPPVQHATVPLDGPSEPVQHAAAPRHRAPSPLHVATDPLHVAEAPRHVAPAPLHVAVAPWHVAPAALQHPTAPWHVALAPVDAPPPPLHVAAGPRHVAWAPFRVASAALHDAEPPYHVATSLRHMAITPSRVASGGGEGHG
jgi:hypothetical protein